LVGEICATHPITTSLNRFSISADGEKGDNLFPRYRPRLHWVDVNMELYPPPAQSLTYSMGIDPKAILAISPDITHAIFYSGSYLSHVHLPTMTFTPITHPNVFKNMIAPVVWNDDDTFSLEIDNWRYVLRFKQQD
jgi:hypothetical protein